MPYSVCLNSNNINKILRYNDPHTDEILDSGKI